MLLFLIFFAMGVGCARKITMKCFTGKDCKGTSAGPDSGGTFEDGKCEEEYGAYSTKISCTINGNYNYFRYLDTTCKNKDSKASATGGSCMNLDWAGSCKFEGCINVLAIVLGVCIPVVVICCCCLLLIVIGIVIVLSILALRLSKKMGRGGITEGKDDGFDVYGSMD